MKRYHFAATLIGTVITKLQAVAITLLAIKTTIAITQLVIKIVAITQLVLGIVAIEQLVIRSVVIATFVTMESEIILVGLQMDCIQMMVFSIQCSYL
jgi:hypothetical protein